MLMIVIFDSVGRNCLIKNLQIGTQLLIAILIQLWRKYQMKFHTNCQAIQ